MAKDPAAKPARGKDSKGKRPKKAKAPRGEKWKQIVAAYKITRQRDRGLPLWMAIAFLGGFAVLLLLCTLIGTPIYLSIPVAVLFGVLALMIVFSRRAQKAAFRQIEVQPGAAGWVL